MKRCLAFFFVVTILSACVSQPPRKGVPRFDRAMPVPIGVRVIDARPEKERVGGRHADGIYAKQSPALVMGRFAEDLGNALSAYGAVRSWYPLAPDQANERQRLMIEVEIKHWSAHLPFKKRDKYQKNIFVRGRCVASWRILQDGKVRLRGKQSDGLGDLALPLRAIKADTVEEVIPAALGSQLQKVERAWIEAAMLDMADDWHKILPKTGF